MRFHYWLCLTICGLTFLTGCAEEGGKTPSATVFDVSEPLVPVAKPIVVFDAIPERCKEIAPMVVDFQNPSWALAQLDQESNCNYFAVSPVGAQGIAQIMPGNLGWLGSDICAELGEPNPYDPDWAVPCFELFMQWHSIDLFPDYCGNLYVDSQRYNGGYYVIWEVRASSDKTLQGGEDFCGTRLPNGRKRSKASCHENYEYPEKISERQRNFISLGGIKC